MLTRAVSRFPYGPQPMQTRLGSTSEPSRQHSQLRRHQAPRAQGPKNEFQYILECVGVHLSLVLIGFGGL